MAKEVGFGILGLGRGRKAAQTAVQTAGANLVCVCDLQEEKVKAQHKSWTVIGQLHTTEC